jgi:hypothetical protein
MLLLISHNDKTNTLHVHVQRNIQDSTCSDIWKQGIEIYVPILL